MPKRDEVASFLNDSNSDIVAITETWLTPDITDNEIILGNSTYNIYPKDRTERRGGGVLLGIKQTLSSFLIDTNSPLEIVWVACATLSTKALIGVCYRPPDNHGSFVDDLRKSLAKATQNYPCDNIYLFGDFNYPHIDWTHLSSSCRESNDFLNLLLDFNLFQFVNQPTRGANVLDLILTSAPNTVNSILYLEGSVTITYFSYSLTFL